MDARRSPSRSQPQPPEPDLLRVPSGTSLCSAISDHRVLAGGLAEPLRAELRAASAPRPSRRRSRLRPRKVPPRAVAPRSQAGFRTAGNPARLGTRTSWLGWWSGPLPGCTASAGSASDGNAMRACHQRGRRRLAGLPARPGRPRPGRGAAGDQRRPPRAEAGDRGGARRRRLAALPDPLHAQPPEPGAEVRPGDGGDAGAHDLRAARRRLGPGPARPVVRQLAERFPAAAGCWPRPRARSWPSPASPRSTGARSGRPTPWSGSTRSCAAAPTSSASSPTARRSSASSGRCSPSSTTSGPSPAAT